MLRNQTKRIRTFFEMCKLKNHVRNKCIILGFFLIWEFHHCHRQLHPTAWNQLNYEIFRKEWGEYGDGEEKS